VQDEDAVTEVHSIYQSISFTEDLIENMCSEAKKLMKLVDPKTLIEKYKSFFDER
jgi:hypothetical protein